MVPAIVSVVVTAVAFGDDTNGERETAYVDNKCHLNSNMHVCNQFKPAHYEVAEFAFELFESGQMILICGADFELR